MTRRVAIGSVLLAGCGAGAASNPELRSRPAKPAGRVAPGVHPLGIRKQRDTLLYAPQSLPAQGAAPLVVYLHGAGGSENQGIKRMSAFADAFGFLLLSPASAGGTWDAIQDGFGADVRTVDQALARAFAMHTVDARKVAVCGFSDGASYALGLGLSNGDLFPAVLAFSPGFIPPGVKIAGKPRLFFSHGTNDEILPIANCSRRLVPELKRAGYTVNYREFDGPHTVPKEIADEAFHWFLA